MCVYILLLLFFSIFIGEKSFNFYFFFRWCESQLRAEKGSPSSYTYIFFLQHIYIHIEELWSFTHNSDSARLIVVIRSPAELICAPPSARPALYIYSPLFFSLFPAERTAGPAKRVCCPPPYSPLSARRRRRLLLLIPPTSFFTSFK